MLNVSNTVVMALLLLLFQSAASAPAHSGERHLVLTNNTREPIVEIYLSDDRATIGSRICWARSFCSPASPCPSISTIETAIAGST